MRKKPLYRSQTAVALSVPKGESNRQDKARLTRAKKVISENSGIAEYVRFLPDEYRQAPLDVGRHRWGKMFHSVVQAMGYVEAIAELVVQECDEALDSGLTYRMSEVANRLSGYFVTIMSKMTLEKEMHRVIAEVISVDTESKRIEYKVGEESFKALYDETLNIRACKTREEAQSFL